MSVAPAATEQLISDAIALRAFWRAIAAPGDVREVRIVESRRGPRRFFRTVSGYFDDEDAFVSALSNIAGEDAAGVSVTLNPVNPALLARAANRLANEARATTADADIVRRTHLLIDVDPVRPSHISATDEERATALAKRDDVLAFLTEEAGWPEPVVVMESGNGGALAFAVNLPNDDESTTLVGTVLASLAASFNSPETVIDVANANASRTMKVAGTVAAKGDPIPSRVWRMASASYPPAAVVPRSALVAVAALAPPPRSDIALNGNAPRREWDVRDVLRGNGLSWRERAKPWGTVLELDHCLTSPDHNDAACVIEFPSGALAYRCLHNRCADKTWSDVRELLGLPTVTSVSTLAVNGKHDTADYDRTDNDNRSGTAGVSREEKQDRRSAADRLIGYARAALTANDYLRDQFGQAQVLVKGVPLALPRGVYPWLRMLMWQHEERGANGEALQIAAGILEAMALHAGRTVELHVRSAWFRDALYVELKPGRVCRIDDKGYKVVTEPPVLFRRYVNLLPLPEPTRGRDLDGLFDLIVPDDNTDDAKAARRLLRAYITLGLLPDVARPILLFTGPQGSGKTSRQRLIKRLLDPTKPESLRLDQRDFVQKVAHAQIVLFDNLNMLPDWAVDAFCRLVTGEADSKRVLYSDDQDFIYELRRLVMLNGINPPGDRPDFADRSLPIELRRIGDADRKEEAAIAHTFDELHAEWLGATFDLLARAIACRPAITPARLPRLADWGRWAMAVYAAMGEGPSQFWADWQRVVERQHAAAIDGSPVAQTIIAFMKERETWTGAPGTLYEALGPVVTGLGLAKAKEWPKDVRWLGRRLREVGPVLVERGITVTDERGADRRTITIRKEPTNDDDDDMTTETPRNQGVLHDDINDNNDDMPPDVDIEKPAPNQVVWRHDNNDDIFGPSSDDPSDTSDDDPPNDLDIDPATIDDLLAFSPEELARWRDEVNAASDDDPYKAYDLAALRRVDALKRGVPSS